MTIYLNDFDDCEDCYYDNQGDDTEYNSGFVAKFGQWRDRWFYLRNGLELAISTDEYSDFVIERCDPNEDFLKFQFCLSGAIKIEASGDSQSVSQGAGCDTGWSKPVVSPARTASEAVSGGEPANPLGATLLPNELSNRVSAFL